MVAILDVLESSNAESIAQ